MREEIAAIIAENDRRNAEIFAAFNPITGLGSIGERVRVEIADFPLKVMYIPVAMARVKLVKRIVEAGSIEAFVREEFGAEHEPGEEERSKVVEQLVRLRCLHDFPFWAAMFVYIKAKGGGEDVLFRLTRPQRRFVERLEKKRLAGLPIRIVLLKARQWGGSTLCYLLIYLENAKNQPNSLLLKIFNTNMTVDYLCTLHYFPISSSLISPIRVVSI